MSEPGPEEEAARAFARQLFGSQQPEPKEEPAPTNDATEAKDAEPNGEHDPTELEAKPEPSDPEQAHAAFLGNLLRGGAAKREADRAFFESMPGLGFTKTDEAKEGDE
jgi:hypothetical protein